MDRADEPRTHNGCLDLMQARSPFGCHAVLPGVIPTTATLTRSGPPRKGNAQRVTPNGSLTTLRDKFIKIGAKMVTTARYVILQVAEGAKG